MRIVFASTITVLAIGAIGCDDQFSIGSSEPAPFKAEFVEMVYEIGMSRPNIRVTNTSDKEIYAIIVKYECYDEAGNILPHDHASGALVSGSQTTGDEVHGIFRPNMPHEVTFGLNRSWIPKGTVKVTVEPQWAQYMDDETWGDNSEFTEE